jgi:hypothetical protein
MTHANGVPHRGAGGGARARASDCPRFRGLVRHVHGLGPRAVGEAMLELAPNRGAVVAVLKRYARLDRRLVEVADAADWLEPRALLREVRR